MPRYRIHQASYIDDVPYAAGAEVELDERHVPGPHWEALDAAAKALCENLGTSFTGDVPDVLPALANAYGEAIARATQEMTPQKLAGLMAQSIAAARVAEREADKLDAEDRDKRLAALVAAARVAEREADKLDAEDRDKRLAALVAAAVKAAIPSPEQFVDGIDKVLAARAGKR